MVMIRINIAEAKTNLSRHLMAVEQGETVLICRRNVPIAEIRPIPPRSLAPRPVGVDRGMVIPQSFFEPLPDDLIEAFNGEAS
ncbi:MAG: hypothetical protein AMXMBFR64_10560 [Myxococcales bacterium]